MSDHSKTLVPLESWSYLSPEIRYNGGSIDIGLMAEALIYYDQVLINVANQPQFAEFLSWFIRQSKFHDLVALFNDQTLKIYEYSFACAPLKQPNGDYLLINIQDEIQAIPNTFEQRYLYHESVNKCLKHARERKKLFRALRNKVIEVKANAFGDAVVNAKIDFLNTERCAHIVQALMDEVYPLLNLKKSPEIKAKLSKFPDKYTINWNVNFDEISNKLGDNLNFNNGTPLAVAANCNRFLLSAANLNCDLYLGSPMSTLVGDKLYESTQKIIKSKNVVEGLINEVEFPDIRALVNAGKLNLDEIFQIRRKAQKFRIWLQEESERDRDAIIAYHNEIAKDLGLVKYGRKSLRMFGMLGLPYTRK